jgi:5-formyltetrahydrofolate cyclo-ligase
MLNLPENLSKEEIRKICLDLRDNISPDLHENYTHSIWNRLYETEEYKAANCVLTYASIASEPSTTLLITHALSDGKRVYCPRICGDYMEFVRIKGVFELKPTGKYNIPEPQKTSCDEIYDASFYSDNKSICIIPALSVDLAGTRLGYGKGYYDKYLSAIKRKEIVGIDKLILICGLFSALSTEKLPRFTHDISVDIVITEEEMFKPRNYSERFI